MTPKWAELCESGLLFYRVWASISNRLTLECSQCTPSTTVTFFYLLTMKMLPRWHSQAVWWSFLALLYPQSTLTFLSPTVYSLTRLLCGQWILLNNKPENFLCPGNVPLAIHVILISRPQCSKGRPSVLRTYGISAQNVFFTFFPKPWIQSMTFTGGIQSGHLSDSLVGKWKWHQPNLLFPQQGGRNAIFSLDHAVGWGGMGGRRGKETPTFA